MEGKGNMCLYKAIPAQGNINISHHVSICGSTLAQTSVWRQTSIWQMPTEHIWELYKEGCKFCGVTPSHRLDRDFFATCGNQTGPHQSTCTFPMLHMVRLPGSIVHCSRCTSIIHQGMQQCSFFLGTSLDTEAHRSTASSTQFNRSIQWTICQLMKTNCSACEEL